MPGAVVALLADPVEEREDVFVYLLSAPHGDMFESRIRNTLEHRREVPKKCQPEMRTVLGRRTSGFPIVVVVETLSEAPTVTQVAAVRDHGHGHVARRLQMFGECLEAFIQTPGTVLTIDPGAMLSAIEPREERCVGG